MFSKIRLEIQGKAAKVEGAVSKGAIHIIRQLGILGLYKGASACLFRIFSDSFHIVLASQVRCFP